MNAQAIELAPLASEDQQHRVLDLVLDRLSSDNSKIAYAPSADRLSRLIRRPASARLEQGCRPALPGIPLDAGLAPSSINQKLSEIRVLASEAADNGLLDRDIAAAIKEVKGVKTAGTRAGNWACVIILRESRTRPL
jgi:hypothetical protein